MESPDEKEWFFLFQLSKLGALSGIEKNTTKIANQLQSSQQTISRRINSLKEKGYIVDFLKNDKINLKLSDKGISVLNHVYSDLKRVLIEKEKQHYYGQVQTGLGEGKFYVQMPGYHSPFEKILHNPPFPGTLNVLLATEYLEEFYYTLSHKFHHTIDGFESNERTYGAVKCYEIYLATNGNSKNKVECLLVDIRRTSHQKDTVEVISHLNLREILHLVDGSLVRIEFH